MTDKIRSLEPLSLDAIKTIDRHGVRIAEKIRQQTIRKGKEMTDSIRIRTRQDWYEAIIWDGDEQYLPEAEEKRNDDIQNLLADALEAANRGGDFSTPIYEIIKKYGSYDREGI